MIAASPLIFRPFYPIQVPLQCKLLIKFLFLITINHAQSVTNRILTNTSYENVQFQKSSPFTSVNEKSVYLQNDTFFLRTHLKESIQICTERGHPRHFFLLPKPVTLTSSGFFVNTKIRTDPIRRLRRRISPFLIRPTDQLFW